MSSKLPDHVVTISIDSTGEITKRPWPGTFKVKLLLSHEERFEFERKYKEFLPDDKGIDDDTKFRASALSELAVRVLDGPEWWSGSRQGRNLVDSAPIIDLMTQINTRYEEWLKKVEEIANEESKA